MEKLLIITPRLSTGGQPQYVLKKIELLNDLSVKKTHLEILNLISLTINY
jgi:hypothetical protein